MIAENAEIGRSAQTTPTCTVRFDDRAGCGINLEVVSGNGRTSFIGVTFVTRRGEEEPHDLTFAQVGQLQAALSALVAARADHVVEQR
ncbi:hypothetical protein GCM10007977_061720 [Dactylosporangium sucinum]|uniref:Uncharacterized protein n=2 Tax=Dactylosporangium sucinum TaxID=1424081 RepID=A0A917U1M1_9ACTN|nr:hypothetical protein GCM10007977_061720 [Dactylosporangium sucinum]